MDAWTIVGRIAAALAVGAIIGLNRDLRRKPAGVRTHAMVAIGSAVVVLVAIEAGSGPDGLTRVLQGLVAGIGFLGAGVIIHHETEHRVQGLTTAATLWAAAGFGAACGAGMAEVVLAGVAAALLVLLFGGWVERAFERRLGGTQTREAEENAERLEREPRERSE